MNSEDFNNLKEEIGISTKNVESIEDEIKKLKLLLPNYIKKLEHAEGEIDDLDTDSKEIQFKLENLADEIYP
jgi:archaellum component FlaC